MKRKFAIYTAIILLILCFSTVMAACNASEKGSVKAITKPYIAQYECTEATLSGKDILKDFEFIRVTFLDGKSLEVSFKRSGEKKHAVICPYVVDSRTREFTADFGFLGMKFQQSTHIENGQFTVARQIGNHELVFKFKIK